MLSWKRVSENLNLVWYQIFLLLQMGCLLLPRYKASLLLHLSADNSNSTAKQQGMRQLKNLMIISRSRSNHTTYKCGTNQPSSYKVLIIDLLDPNISIQSFQALRGLSRYWQESPHLWKGVILSFLECMQTSIWKHVRAKRTKGKSMYYYQVYDVILVKNTFLKDFLSLIS